MPSVAEIKNQLKLLKIKGITGKTKAQLFEMLPEGNCLKFVPVKKARAAKPAPEPAPVPIKAPAAKKSVAQKVSSPEKVPIKTISKMAIERQEPSYKAMSAPEYKSKKLKDASEMETTDELYDAIDEILESEYASKKKLTLLSVTKKVHDYVRFLNDFGVGTAEDYWSGKVGEIFDKLIERADDDEKAKLKQLSDDIDYVRAFTSIGKTLEFLKSPKVSDKERRRRAVEKEEDKKRDEARITEYNKFRKTMSDYREKAAEEIKILNVLYDKAQKVKGIQQRAYGTARYDREKSAIAGNAVEYISDFKKWIMERDPEYYKLRYGTLSNEDVRKKAMKEFPKTYDSEDLYHLRRFTY